MSKSSIQITSIHCHDTSESGHDEVYLVCQADAGFPIRYPAKFADAHSMASGDTWTLDPPLTLHFKNEVLVTLWDQDISYDPNVATFLQCNDFRPGSGSGSVTLTNPNDADYTVYYTYLD